MSSNATSKTHNPEALRLLAELHCLLDDPSPEAHTQAISANWESLKTTYHTFGSHLESRKNELGGSWEGDKPDRSDEFKAKRKECANVLKAATHDYSTHSAHTTSLGRQILALSAPDQQWERTFLLWRFKLARADLDRMDRRCERLAATVRQWAKRKRREDWKAVAFYKRVHSEMEEFMQLERSMREAEGKLKAFWARRPRRCRSDSGRGEEARAEEVRGLEAWRHWPVGRVCGGGELVFDSVMGYEHG